MIIDIVILAAGQGTRMHSALPKVLHCLAGEPLLQRVVNTASSVPDSKIIIVTGRASEEVKASISGEQIHYAQQDEQLGTAHAVQAAVSVSGPSDITLILYGDVPLISKETVLAVIDTVDNDTMALLTVTLEDPEGYGRILRDKQGDVCGIIEQKDAPPEALKIQEVNTGVLALKTSHLREWLPQIDNKNTQGEYYLTDLVAIAKRSGINVVTKTPRFPQEVAGVNTRIQLSKLERFYQQQQAEKLMMSGVTVADPNRIDIRGSLSSGNDNFIDINVVFEGVVKLGNNVSIGPNCLITDSIIGDSVQVKANSVIEKSEIYSNAVIGPFARLRPGTVVCKNAKIGNFVEVKNTQVGIGSKISHLSYVGDAELGADVNVGAGTITCNYDGANKHKTIIADNSFIGSNSSLVAPLKIGKNATIGAGSIIIKDVPDDQLTLARAPQKNVPYWVRPTKKK